MTLNGHVALHEQAGDFANVGVEIKLESLDVLLESNKPIELRVWGSGSCSYVLEVGDIR